MPAVSTVLTVVGNVVNVASRLAATTRGLGCTTIASEEFVAMAGTLNAERLFHRRVEVKLRGVPREVKACWIGNGHDLF